MPHANAAYVRSSRRYTQADEREELEDLARGDAERFEEEMRAWQAAHAKRRTQTRSRRIQEGDTTQPEDTSCVAKSPGTNDGADVQAMDPPPQKKMRRSLKSTQAA